MHARVSIVTPSFNQGKYIERTIQSVLSQNVDGLEYMVIDGGSTDETLQVLESYENRLFWTSERDRGPADAINKGFLRSSAPILGWLNSDDIYYPGALEAVLDFFEKNPHADVVYGDADHIDEAGTILEKYPTEEWSWKRLHEVCFISQPAAFFRRRVFEKYGPLDVGLRCMDYEYWLRLGKEGACFLHFPEILAATRLHKEAFTIAGRVAGHREMNTFTRKHLGRAPDKWLFNYAHAVVEAKGYSREKPFRFALAVSAVSLGAALRWNKRLSMHMLKTIAQWIGGSAIKACSAPVALNTCRRDASGCGEGLKGIYADGWTEEQVVIRLEESDIERHIEMTLQVPPWFPFDFVTVRKRQNGNQTAAGEIKRGESVTFTMIIPPGINRIGIDVSPTFQPKALNMGEDERHIGCLCLDCCLVSGSERKSFLA